LAVGTPVRLAGGVPLLAVVALILVPGGALGYFGFRALAEREQSLRTNYTATTVLVRDRMRAELVRLESSLTAPANASELAALKAGRDWLETSFILRADGNAMTARLHEGTQRLPPDPLEQLPSVAAVVADAEHAEFVRRDLDAALRSYRDALNGLPSSSVAARAFVLTRVGRTLFKLRRFGEGIAAYERAAALAADALDRNGLPFAVIARLQIVDGFDALHRTVDMAASQQELAHYVLDHPWDLENGYAEHLVRVLDFIPRDDPAQARVAGLRREVAELDWIRTQMYPRVRAELTAREAQTSDARHAVIGARLIGYLRLSGNASDIPAVFAYEVRPDFVSGPLLAQVLKTVDLGSAVHVSVLRRDGAPVDPNGVHRTPLAEVEFLPSIPEWRVALFDNEGRSIPQLVGRERWIYGALLGGMLIVMCVGVALTVRASARATQLARARSDFVSNVSHELKTPLALIRMFGETLESGIVTDPEKRQEFYGIIRRESERLTHLIDNVLDLNRIDQGTKRYDIGRHDLVETVRAALDAYRPLFDRLGFVVRTELPQPPVDVAIDRDAVIQSLVNLFQNVIKYSGTARCVLVKVQRDDGTAAVSVSDRGVGIAAEQIHKIFERYYRVPDVLTDAPAGSGLGLTLVKHTMDAHHGRVTVQSTAGEGSTFTLVFPVILEEAATVQTDSDRVAV
jgi:signal transduction histidine kinase/tetratricopeptide (TPR) repeat protein